MIDQANELRELVRREAERLQTSSHCRPRFLVVSGGRDGVGTTTVALRLAIEASRSGRRVLLVDADANRGDAASICRLEERYTLADVLSARRSVGEAIQPGPAGIWVLPGGWTGNRVPGHEEETPGQFRTRLAQPLKAMGERFDAIVIDAGNGANHVTTQRWREADTVLLVTTTDLPAVMDSYATVKHSTVKETSMPVFCLVNMSPDAETAISVFTRMERSCRRFLGISLQNAGYLSRDSSLAELISQGKFIQPAVCNSSAVDLLAGLVESLIPKNKVFVRQAS
ncbi:MAG: AAA family ATPase [Pirellulales bacterium]|nr:AAA family ATPase [Pirellulales bacterium]